MAGIALPVEPPSPEEPSPSPTITDTDPQTSNTTKDTMDTSSEHKLDVSACSGRLTTSVSTEAMLRDLRKMNPTYSSDLSVNRTLSVDAGVTSPTYSASSKSPTSKR